MEMSDYQLLHGLARHLRKHELLCFDPDDSREQQRAEVLIAWFADNINSLDVPTQDEPYQGEPAATVSTIGNALQQLADQSQVELREHLEQR